MQPDRLLAGLALDEFLDPEGIAEIAPNIPEELLEGCDRVRGDAEERLYLVRETVGDDGCPQSRSQARLSDAEGDFHTPLNARLARTAPAVEEPQPLSEIRIPLSVQDVLKIRLRLKRM